MNKVVLIGRLTADPEVRQSSSGKTVANYTLAVDRRFKTEGQQEADFIRCVAFGSNGDFASKYLHKGMKIALEGRIVTSSYTKDDGTKVYKTEVAVEHPVLIPIPTMQHMLLIRISLKSVTKMGICRFEQ